MNFIISSSDLNFRSTSIGSSIFLFFTFRFFNKQWPSLTSTETKESIYRNLGVEFESGRKILKNILLSLSSIIDGIFF